jgi:hypothetical protein
MVASAASQACSFYLGRLESEVARLRTVAFPGRDKGPQQWLNLVVGILKTAEGYLEKASATGLTPAEISRYIIDAEDLGASAYEFMNLASGVDIAQIPEQVIGPFLRWVKGLGIDQTIFFRAEHLPNYELAWLDGRQLGKVNFPDQSLTNAISDIKWPALRVTVPAQAMGMLPHFAVVGHELGHAIQDLIKPDLSSCQGILTTCFQEIRRYLGRTSFSADDSFRIQTVVKNWINEFKADAVGYFLVGPAFFFALCGFLELAGRGYGVGLTHPPSDLRRRLVHERINKGPKSFSDVFLAKTTIAITENINSPHLLQCPAPDQLFVELSAEVGEDAAAVCAGLLPYAECIGDAIFVASESYLRATCPSLIYSPDGLEFDLATQLDPLCQLIPPIEVVRPGVPPEAATFASILNVGWAALLSRINDVSPARSLFGDETARRMERLHDLLLKAVELSEARSLWDEQK